MAGRTTPPTGTVTWARATAGRCGSGCPTEGSVTWDDVVRGEITFENANIEDFVIRRADGSPTFFVANAMDDADMGVTHVIRGEDLINVTPKQLLLRDALGWPAST